MYLGHSSATYAICTSTENGNGNRFVISIRIHCDKIRLRQLHLLLYTTEDTKSEELLVTLYDHFAISSLHLMGTGFGNEH